MVYRGRREGEKGGVIYRGRREWFRGRREGRREVRGRGDIGGGWRGRREGGGKEGGVIR